MGRQEMGIVTGFTSFSLYSLVLPLVCLFVCLYLGCVGGELGTLCVLVNHNCQLGENQNHLGDRPLGVCPGGIALFR